MPLKVRRLHMLGAVENVDDLLDASMEWLTRQASNDALDEGRSAVLFKSVPCRRRPRRKTEADDGCGSDVDSAVGRAVRDCGSAA